MRKTIEVAAAIILDAQGRIFATQRGYGEWKGWWEFPGGKIEPGETPQEACPLVERAVRTYNTLRPHTCLGIRTPAQVYEKNNHFQKLEV